MFCNLHLLSVLRETRIIIKLGSNRSIMQFMNNFICFNHATPVSPVFKCQQFKYLNFTMYGKCLHWRTKFARFFWTLSTDTIMLCNSKHNEQCILWVCKRRIGYHTVYNDVICTYKMVPLQSCLLTLPMLTDFQNSFF